MTHEACTARLSDYLDEELTADERAAVAAHLAGCAACRDVLSELTAVAFRASALPEAAGAPAMDLWSGVADRIRRDGTRRLPRRTFSFTLPQLVAAGLALMVLSGSLVWVARIGGERTDFPAVTAVKDPRPAQLPAVTPANFADAQYDRAIADLQETLEAGRSRLDPETVRVLEASIAAVDRAIEQSYRAVEEDPANTYLNSHLAEARKRKLALLRQAATIADLGS